MVVNTNMQALRSHRALKNTTVSQNKASQRLSTGLRINSASDDAAGLAISERMKTQIRGMDQADRNTQDGVSLLQTGESGLEEVQSMLQRIRELAVQSATGTNSTDDREALNAEVDQLNQEITAMTSTKLKYNEQTLFDGTFGVRFQVGANKGETISVTLACLSANALSLTAMLVTSESNANITLDKVDAALDLLSETRAYMGAIQNRLEYTSRNLTAGSENLSAANSRIVDTDMAKEMMEYTQANVLNQAATNMLAQANQAPQNILQLLG